MRTITLTLILGSMAAGPVCRGAENMVIAGKTLVAWVAPANLTQRGGSVLTIEKSRGVFDAIVFGELATSKWMAGSKYADYTADGAERFSSESIVLMGLRHVDAMPQNRFFTGSIDDARIYDVALDAEQVDDLLEQIDAKVDAFYGDGAYDQYLLKNQRAEARLRSRILNHFTHLGLPQFEWR